MGPNWRRSNGQQPQGPRRPKNDARNAKQHYQSYLARARDAQLSGDVVAMENWCQHAEHYYRVMKDSGDERRD